MNLSASEIPYDIIAKTCGCEKNSDRKIRYLFIDSYHSLCNDKKDIMISEIKACERLKNFIKDESFLKIIETEIAELKKMLGLLS